jgi:hypothetical protein
METTMTYTATLSGSQWATGPVATFPTISAAREWAEAYGTTADRCEITDHKGRVVSVHVRDTSGDGTRWFRGATAAAR